MKKNSFILPILFVFFSSCSLIEKGDTPIAEPKNEPRAPLTEQQKANQENLDNDLNTLYTSIFE